MTARSPRYRTRDGAPGRMCKCGHREGSHNDLARCCAGECMCGSSNGGFDPTDHDRDRHSNATEPHDFRPAKGWDDCLLCGKLADHPNHLPAVTEYGPT